MTIYRVWTLTVAMPSLAQNDGLSQALGITVLCLVYAVAVLLLRPYPYPSANLLEAFQYLTAVAQLVLAVSLGFADTPNVTTSRRALALTVTL